MPRSGCHVDYRSTDFGSHFAGAAPMMTIVYKIRRRGLLAMEAVTGWAIAKWTLIALAFSPVIVGIGWVVSEGMILPRLIPRAEIERLADAMMVLHPDDPEEAAFLEEQAAWHRSENLEQGKWHRVGEAIQRRAARRRL